MTIRNSASGLLVFFFLSLVLLLSCDNGRTDKQNNLIDKSNTELTVSSTYNNSIESREASLFFWKGFSHKWLRTIVGFSIPHRISTLKSYVDNTKNIEEGGSHYSEFIMGQNTGVDGNFMKPVGHYQFMNISNVHAVHGKIELNWTDTGSGTDYPEAVSVIEREILIPLDKYDNTDKDISTVFLSGISLKTTCDDEKQPCGKTCNSNGMWPYKFSISLIPGIITREGYKFTAQIDIRRAWTPNKGGIPLIEEKPFDERLDFNLKIHYTVMGGDAAGFAVSDKSSFTVNAQLRDNKASSGQKTLHGSPGFDHATSVISSIGFQFSPHSRLKKFNHLGRYIGKMNFSISNDSYNTASGLMNYNYLFHVWSPDTVCQSNIEYSITTRLLQFRQANTIGTEKKTTGSLCCNSKDNAPFFSKWLQCGKKKQGPEQEVDAVSITSD